MRFAAAAVLFLLPLALAPAWFFYYDVTPKACVLYLGAALLAALAWTSADGLRAAWSARPARWYLILVAASAVSAMLAASASPYSRLAWMGSNWRRGGAITEIATLAAAVLIAACPLRSILAPVSAAGIFASVYGIAQYAGWDPWISKSAYVIGEGVYQIVRPPATLGHSDYFAAFSLWPVFAGAGLWMSGRWRWLGAAAAATGVAGILVAGSRGAWLGLLAGACVLAYLRRPPLRATAAAMLAATLALALFLVSPAGARMRARAFWISEDPAGGARLLLWRDSIQMAASRPALGLGPDVFPAVFPRHQSRDLARAYPDFAHESPHNMFLDALAGAGVAGMLSLFGIAAVGCFAGWKSRADPGSGALAAGLAACLTAQQFVVFTVPTALLFYGIAGLLAFGQRSAPPPAGSRLKLVLVVIGLAAAAGFSWAAHRIGSGDRALWRARAAAEAGNMTAAAKAWADAAEHRSTGVTADIELSRFAAAAAAKTPLLSDKLVFSQLAASAAEAATRSAENRANAWYNLALLQAASNDAPAVEASLRAAVDSAPVWYKPHWMLARVLAASGRAAEARREAEIAVSLNRGAHPEVAETLEPVLRSSEPAR